MKVKVWNSEEMKGEITIGGSKNACLPEMVAALLTTQELKLTNVPAITDVEVMIKILAKVKVSVKYNKELKILSIKRKRKTGKINCPYISKIRASYYLMGTMFSLNKTVITSLPGGCSFVKRPIDYHLNAFKQMGAIVIEKNNKIIIRRKRKKQAEITLPTPSIGATINIIFASVLTKGKTFINNPSLEPEVLDVISLLNKMKANIEIINNQIVISGVKKLFGTTHQVIPDRMEAGSYMLLAASVKKSNLLLKNVIPSQLTNVIDMLKNQGLNILTKQKEIRVIKDAPLKGTKLIADVYPSFPTDLQQIACSFFLTCESFSIIKDNVYPKRFSEVIELMSMDGKIFIKDNLLIIMPSKLKEGNVYAADLRAGFSLIVAASIAPGETIINNADVIFRGYENIIEKLKNCQIKIERL